MDNKLYKNEERFSLAMRGANDGLWDWNLETDEVYYSPRWKSMLGYQEDELSATIDTWKAHVHPDDRDFVLEKAQDYLEGRAESFEVEMRMHHKEGHIVYILSRAFLTRHESNDKPNRLVGTHVDITERKKSEQFIIETSDILQMIATGDPASNIYNAIALLYESRHPGLRCSMLVLVGNKLMHGGAPSLPQEYCDAVNGLENGPDVGSCGTSTYTGKSVFVESIETDPKWKNLKDAALPHGMRSCWSEPIKNASGKVLGAFGMYYDYPALPNDKELNDLRAAARLAAIIMNRDHSEKELNQHRQNLEELVSQRTLELENAKKMAESANLAKSDFLSSMSHELRTPLNAVMGFAQLLQMDSKNALSEEQNLHVSHILKGGSHLLELIGHVLELNKIEAGRLSLNIENIYAQDVISESLDLVSSRAVEKGIEIIDETKGGNFPILRADGTRLTQVLLNLLSNAIKYNDERGKVTLSCQEISSQYLRINVADTGLGISEDDQNKLFQPFERLGLESGTIEGTGIGLTITRQIIELMGGQVDFKSKKGEGSTFWVDVPTSNNPVETLNSTAGLRQSTEHAESTTNNQNIRTLLYIEDNPGNLQLMETIIGNIPNLKLLTAYNAELGLDLAKSQNPNLILMDINLPGMNGFEALKQLQKSDETQSIPVIAVTAEAMPKDIKAGTKAGFKEYITKPLDVANLIRTIERVISEKISSS